MSSLYLVNLYDGNPVKDLAYIDTRMGGVEPLIITNRRLDEPYTGEIKVNFTNRNGVFNPIWDEINNDTFGKLGFRYQTDEQNLAFKVEDKFLDMNGQWNIKLVSVLQSLTEVESYPDRVLNDTNVTDILSQLSTNFRYTLLSQDRKVDITTARKSDFIILQEICKYAENWAFRDNGLVANGDGNWIPEVLIGNFGNDMEAYQTTNVKCSPVYISNHLKIDNPNNLDVAKLDNIKQHFKTDYVTHLFVYGDNNQGGSVNSRTELDPKFIKDVDSRYPLEKVTRKGKTYYVIVNKAVDGSPRRELSLPFQSSTNDQEANNSLVPVNDIVSAQKLYSYGKSWLQASTKSSYISFSDSLIKKLTLPGNLVYIDFNISLRTGSKYLGFKKIYKEIFSVKDFKVLNQLENINLSVITK